jgi:hypothetical protein
MESATPRERDISEITPERFVRTGRALIDLVDERLPQRVYRGEGRWAILGQAFVARMADILRSLIRLADAGVENDRMVLLRTLYEHVVTFCWIAVDPERRLPQWGYTTHIYRLQLHFDALAYGTTILSDSEVAAIKRLRKDNAGMPGIAQRAAEVDDYWPSVVRGFRTPPEAGADLLTMKGLYAGIYRIASRSVHAQLEAIEQCVDFSRLPRGPAVVRPQQTDHLFSGMVAVPLFALALLVCHHRFRWPKEERIFAVTGSFLRDVDLAAFDERAE